MRLHGYGDGPIVYDAMTWGRRTGNTPPIHLRGIMRRKRECLFALRCCLRQALWFAGTPFSSAETRYAITDLGTLGGASSRALAINDRAQVVGSSQTAQSGDNSHAFLYSDGKMADLGTLGGSESDAFAINASGRVAGVSRVRGDNQHAFVYGDGKMTDLGTLGGTESSASAINFQGDIVGSAQTADGKRHAFLWRKGKMVDLGAFGGTRLTAHAINDTGLIVGSSSGSHWLLLRDGKVIPPAMLPAFYSSGATAINSAGDVVGGGQVGPRPSSRLSLQQRQGN